MKKSMIMALVMVILLSTPQELAIDKPIVEELKVSNHVVIPRTVRTVPTTMKVVKPVREYIDVELTAYDNCYACSEGYKGMTASGVTASRGTVATPKSIKFGTSVYINGVHHRSEDRGGSIIVKSNGAYVIDVWMPSHEQTIKFGRKHGKMYKENGNYYIKY